MVKCVGQKIFKSKATVSKFPAETGHQGTLAAKPVIKKVTNAICYHVHFTIQA